MNYALTSDEARTLRYERKNLETPKPVLHAVYNWMGDNKKALTIIRKSSKEQSIVSHETQEAEIRSYCESHGLTLDDQHIYRIVESAKDSDNRKKYAAAIQTALSQGIRHILFYMYDREARNLTDNERNEKLVKADLIVLHYVRENKVLHRESSDSDFFIRDVQAAANKQYVRNLTVKVVDAMKQKAAMGWYPSNNVPLGYSTKKMTDENGRYLKRGATVGVSPNEKFVRWVQKEFELRAQGYSYRDIRQAIIDEGFVPPEKEKKYRIGAIEQRLKNVFYAGRFFWRGIEYEGKHPLIIPPEIFRAAQRVGRGFKKRNFGTDHGLLADGFLHCAECGCRIIYDPKIKTAKTTGKKTTYHYYHCSNGRMAHISQAGMNVSEDKLWEQLEHAVDAISLTPEFAKKVANALNETQRKTTASGARKITELKDAVRQLEAREDQAYDNMERGNIDAEAYQRQVKRFRAERRELNEAIQAVKSDMEGGFRETALSTLELCKEAKSLYKTRSVAERADFIKKLVSNPRLNNGSIEFNLKKPFGVLAKLNRNENWCPARDLNPHACALDPKSSVSANFTSGARGFVLLRLNEFFVVRSAH